MLQERYIVQRGMGDHLNTIYGIILFKERFYSEQNENLPNIFVRSQNVVKHFQGRKDSIPGVMAVLFNILIALITGEPIESRKIVFREDWQSIQYLCAV
jgi:hypothetical protein